MELQQGSDEWLEWRMGGIGASECPVVMGESDFQTPYGLWEVKTRRAKPFQGNWATRRGTEAESTIRKLYELDQDADFPPCLAQHADHPFMRASLDGLNKERNVIAEFKYPSQLKHDMAKNNIVPPTYQSQIQHQLLVTGADHCDYVSYDGHGIAVVSVYPDRAKMVSILKACETFWTVNVQGDTAPALMDRDFEKIDDPKLNLLFENLKVCRLALEHNENQLEEIKQQIKNAVKKPRVLCRGVKMFHVERKGSIDYSKVPELSGVDLEKYRKPGSKYVTFSVAVEK